MILRHRVKDYRAGQLERLYPKLEIEEDFFLTYGFVTRNVQRLMHPRSESRVPADDTRLPWSAERLQQARLLLEFIRDRGSVHPREVDDHFSHGKVTNYWGGSSNSTTHLLDAMHYQGLLRVTRRENGIRIYSEHRHDAPPADEAERDSRIDSLIDLVVRLYAPMPGTSLSQSIRRLRFAAPQWQDQLSSALKRARERLSIARIDGVDWFWPANERVTGHAAEQRVRFLAPFDPVVRDRIRFELLWGPFFHFYTQFVDTP